MNNGAFVNDFSIFTSFLFFFFFKKKSHHCYFKSIQKYRPSQSPFNSKYSFFDYIFVFDFEFLLISNSHSKHTTTTTKTQLDIVIILFSFVQYPFGHFQVLVTQSIQFYTFFFFFCFGTFKKDENCVILQR